ncbi:hypothetical protein MCP1_410023 [Candidatus Terasakiella magnetica]|nr:hypothetical protein MCP1_410022 [Candidatus Terasakiella magnetica]CAA7624105.1 hypothetical protein MCP1_410023 [Candidatus Terasakiella magnetica]
MRRPERQRRQAQWADAHARRLRDKTYERALRARRHCGARSASGGKPSGRMPTPGV